MTYEERIKVLAKEMAKDYHGESVFVHAGPIEREKVIGQYMRADRIAVKHMDEIAKEAFSAGGTHEESCGRSWDYSEFQKHNGLIASHSKTDPAKEPFTHDQIRCIECSGSGRQHEHSLAQCQNCGGHGLIDVINEDV